MEYHRSTSTPPRFSTSPHRMSGFSGQVSTPPRLSTHSRRSTRDYREDHPHPMPNYQRDTIASLAKQSPRRLSPSIEQRIRVLEAEIAILKNQRGFLATMIKYEKKSDRRSLTADEIASAAERLGLFEKFEDMVLAEGDPEKGCTHFDGFRAV